MLSWGLFQCCTHLEIVECSIALRRANVALAKHALNSFNAFTLVCQLAATGVPQVVHGGPKVLFASNRVDEPC